MFNIKAQIMHTSPLRRLNLSSETLSFQCKAGIIRRFHPNMKTRTKLRQFGFRGGARVKFDANFKI